MPVDLLVAYVLRALLEDGGRCGRTLQVKAGSRGHSVHFVVVRVKPRIEDHRQTNKGGEEERKKRKKNEIRTYTTDT